MQKKKKFLLSQNKIIEISNTMRSLNSIGRIWIILSLRFLFFDVIMFYLNSKKNAI